MSKTETAKTLYAAGKINAWDGSGNSVRVLIGAKWWNLNNKIIAWAGL